MSGRRLALRLILGGLTAVMALVVVALVAGPIAARTIARSQAEHLAAGARLPDTYTPLHKGHIDTSTGLYVREDEDLVLAGAPSFVLRRTYRTRDSRSRAFGIGASHTGEWFLVGDSATFQWADLILEDGGRIHYERTSKGTGIFNARFEHWTTPSSFYGSELAWTGSDWMVRRRDGAILTFRACSPAAGNCGLTSIRDADGAITRFSRDGSGRLLRIVAGTQWIAFDYGDGGRVSRARDHAGRAVEYSYDARGRLRQATGSDGTKRSYEYDDRDRLIRIEEPGRVVENRYDAADMCIWQRVGRPADPVHGISVGGDPYIFQFSYVMAGGRVHQSETRESDGSSHRRVFTASGYLESETYDFDTDHAKTITYQRDARTGLVSGLTFACSGRPRTSRTMTATPATEHRVRAALLTTSCRSARR